MMLGQGVGGAAWDRVVWAEGKDPSIFVAVAGWTLAAADALLWC